MGQYWDDRFSDTSELRLGETDNPKQEASMASESMRSRTGAVERGR